MMDCKLKVSFPCVLLVRPVYGPAVVEHSEVYCFKRACILTTSAGAQGANQDQGTFILPDINKLSAEVKPGSISILFVSCAEVFKDQMDMSSLPAVHSCRSGSSFTLTELSLWPWSKSYQIVTVKMKLMMMLLIWKIKGVIADGHIPWACEAFSNLHGRDLVRAPALLWCWRLHMIKLWNHGLLDARTMNSCNTMLEQFENRDMESLERGYESCAVG